MKELDELRVSEEDSEQRRMAYCRVCICEFQRLGYQDAYLAELKSSKKALLDQYPLPHLPNSD
ncbi:hypothetical protein PCIT_a2185 [Pseudoalteromonas citrea]|uniref:Uncharacterized protein n=2 Tax=Pseudoalteromonas citrea TaxID=43655 RepID=A0AAD4AJD2_9GAMM|nr:hypothetical protein [Pseudoalteromonas citrea]KAF7772168.1 hypothetical protein PCIT_a2185 [Pseudoalteromonas citrea]